MKRIVRGTLSDRTARYLDAQTALIKKKRSSANRKELARQRWKTANRSPAFKEIRQTLESMATGIVRCMYCEDSRGNAIDHFWPLSLYPVKAFEWNNYLFACAYCNSNCKRAQFPVDSAGHPLLIDPTIDDPPTHLVFTPSTGRFGARRGSKKAGPTIEVFGLNTRPELASGRRNAFEALQSLLVDYAEQKRLGNQDIASKIERTIKGYPFGGVFVYLLDVSSGSGAALLRSECLDALRTYPEIKTWR